MARVASVPDSTVNDRKEVCASLLALTDNAVHAVKGIASSSQESAETGGLRWWPIMSGRR
jgi:hypothetical protein